MNTRYSKIPTLFIPFQIMIRGYTVLLTINKDLFLHNLTSKDFYYTVVHDLETNTFCHLTSSICMAFLMSYFRGSSTNYSISCAIWEESRET